MMILSLLLTHSHLLQGIFFYFNEASVFFPTEVSIKYCQIRRQDRQYSPLFRMIKAKTQTPTKLKYLNTL